MPRGQRRLAGVVFHPSSTYSFETGTLTEPGTRLTASKSHCSLHLLPTALGLQVCDHTGLFKWVLRIQTHFLMFEQQALLPLSHFPGPKILPGTLVTFLSQGTGQDPFWKKGLVVLSCWLHTATLSSLRSFLNHFGFKSRC